MRAALGRWAVALGFVLAGGCGAPAAPTPMLAPAAVASPGAAPAGPPPLTAITAAYGSLAAQSAPTWVALEDGLFRQHGLDVTLVRAQDTSALGALAGGDAQLVQLGGEGVINAVLGGADDLFVGSLVNRFAFKLFGARQLTDVQQLRGQSVAVNRPGSSSDVAFRQAIARLGLVPDTDVAFVSIGDSAAQLAALDQGVVAGSVQAAPFDLAADRAGYPMLLDLAALDIPAVQTGYVTTRAYLGASRAVVKAYLAAAREATASCLAGGEGCVRAIMQYSEIDEPTARAAMQASQPLWEPTLRVRPAAITNTLEHAANPQARSAPPEQFYDNSLIDELDGSARR
ncbi:MAG TPA: ABC transporter substrate-binding protein [Chloroflexota bacterium]|nr:ABC transporter substrate-binding protein [Chloroflexota bacterium]